MAVFHVTQGHLTAVKRSLKTSTQTAASKLKRQTVRGENGVDMDSQRADGCSLEFVKRTALQSCHHDFMTFHKTLKQWRQ